MPLWFLRLGLFLFVSAWTAAFVQTKGNDPQQEITQCLEGVPPKGASPVCNNGRSLPNTRELEVSGVPLDFVCCTTAGPRVRVGSSMGQAHAIARCTSLHGGTPEPHVREVVETLEDCRRAQLSIQGTSTGGHRHAHVSTSARQHCCKGSGRAGRARVDESHNEECHENHVSKKAFLKAKKHTESAA